MRIAFFAAGGPYALRPLEALAAEHEIVAVVRPRDTAASWKRSARSLARRLGLRHRDDVGEWCRSRQITSVQADRGGQAAMAAELGALAPDLVCIATFPWLLHRDLLAIPRLGVLNLHPSLLPRHRGPNPFYWTYYCDDRQGGVSVHVATSRADAGPILQQQAIDIPRGWPSSELYLAAARCGTEILREAVSEMERGVARPVAQDERNATSAPRVTPGTPMAKYAEWDVERVWHFFAGLHAWHPEPVHDPKGQPIRYGSVLGFERCAPRGTPGRAEAAGYGWRLWCRDGYLRLGRRGLLPRRVLRSE